MVFDCAKRGKSQHYPLEQSEDGLLSVIVTADMIPFHGHYAMQFRAVKGEVVKHTNQFQVYVGHSLSGDAQWTDAAHRVFPGRAADRRVQRPPAGPRPQWLLDAVGRRSGQVRRKPPPPPRGRWRWSGNVWSQDISTIDVLDRAEYDALPEKDPKTLYLIGGDGMVNLGSDAAELMVGPMGVKTVAVGSEIIYTPPGRVHLHRIGDKGGSIAHGKLF